MFLRRLALALAASAALHVSADYDNFPVKSVNMGAADPITLYKAHLSEDLGVFDAHPVYGFEASDGGLVVCGKSLESEGGKQEGFAFKFSATGRFKFAWTSGVAGKQDSVIACLQLPDGGDIILVGHREVGSVSYRSITKVTLATLAEVWTATDFGDKPNKHGAWESIALTPDGQHVLIGGLYKRDTNGDFDFRSYGNTGGKAIVAKMPVTALTSSTPPTSESLTWTKVWGSRGTAKAVRPFLNGNIGVMLWSEGEEGTFDKATAVDLLDETGSSVWSAAVNLGDTHGEGTEMAVALDGSALLVTGHDGCDANDQALAETMCGKLTKVSATDGAVLWSRPYGSCVTYSSGVFSSWSCGTDLIKNECWGVLPMSDGGYVMSCGSGIETCEGLSGGKKANCNAGTGDLRPDAVPRKEEIWQSLVIRVDADGILQYQRVDQHREPGEPALGKKKWEAASSASEFVAKMAGGDMFFVNDEQDGVGLMKLEDSIATSSPSSSSPLPPPSPSPPPPSPAPPPPNLADPPSLSPPPQKVKLSKPKMSNGFKEKKQAKFHLGVNDGVLDKEITIKDGEKNTDAWYSAKVKKDSAQKIGVVTIHPPADDKNIEKFLEGYQVFVSKKAGDISSKNAVRCGGPYKASKINKGPVQSKCNTVSKEKHKYVTIVRTGKDKLGFAEVVVELA